MARRTVARTQEHGREEITDLRPRYVEVFEVDGGGRIRYVDDCGIVGVRGCDIGNETIDASVRVRKFELHLGARCPQQDGDGEDDRER